MEIPHLTSEAYVAPQSTWGNRALVASLPFWAITTYLGYKALRLKPERFGPLYSALGLSATLTAAGIAGKIVGYLSEQTHQGSGRQEPIRPERPEQSEEEQLQHIDLLLESLETDGYQKWHTAFYQEGLPFLEQRAPKERFATALEGAFQRDIEAIREKNLDYEAIATQYPNLPKGHLIAYLNGYFEQEQATYEGFLRKFGTGVVECYRDASDDAVGPLKRALFKDIWTLKRKELEERMQTAQPLGLSLKDGVEKLVEQYNGEGFDFYLHWVNEAGYETLSPSSPDWEPYREKFRPQYWERLPGITFYFNQRSSQTNADWHKQVAISLGIKQQEYMVYLSPYQTYRSLFDISMVTLQEREKESLRAQFLKLPKEKQSAWAHEWTALEGTQEMLEKGISKKG